MTPTVSMTYAKFRIEIATHVNPVVFHWKWVMKACCGKSPPDETGLPGTSIYVELEAITSFSTPSRFRPRTGWRACQWGLRERSTPHLTNPEKQEGLSVRASNDANDQGVNGRW